MAVTLSSKTQSEAELTEAIVAAGDKPEVQGKEKEAKAVVEEKKPSEAPEKPKVEKPEGEGTKSASEEESDKQDKSQEKPQADDEGDETPVETKAEGDKPKSRGGWQRRLAEMTRQRETLEERYQDERGNRVAIQKELDELKAKMADVQPKDEKEPEKPAELTRPKRPLLKEHDYDQDKLDVALDEYDRKLDEYTNAVADKKANERVAASEESRTKAEQDRKRVEAETAFHQRREKGKAAYEDFDDLAAALPDNSQTLIDRSAVVRNYVANKSKEPAHLIHFLMKDFLEGDEAESNRIMQLDDYDQLLAIRDLEAKLIQEHGKKGTKAAPKVADKEPEDVVVEDEPVEVKAPAKVAKPRVEAPEPPIKPVGSSATAKGKSLDEQMQIAADAGDSKEFRRLLLQQQEEKRAARA